jgi:hypothetical protein
VARQDVFAYRASQGERLMGVNTNWWGFRLRVPPRYAPKPVSIAERLAAGFATAIVLELVCVAALLLSPGTPRTFYRVTAPVCLTLLPLALCLATPRPLLESSGLAAWMVLAREKGNLSRTDLATALACVLSLVLAQFRSLGPVRVALNLILLDSAAAQVSLFAQERIAIHWKRWFVQIPSWLRANLEEEEQRRISTEDRKDSLPADAVMPPDEGAKPVYNLNVSTGIAYPVGIRIPEDVLGRLRDLNAGAHGTLFQSETQAVVLMDRPPVEPSGREEILRLCAQIFSIARKHQLPPTIYANMVLAFVQKAIHYEFDKDSTENFPGGPYPEYGRFAVETLNDGVGDCECTSILCASILSYLGFAVALLWVAADSSTVNHVAVGLEADPRLPLEGLDVVPAKDNSGKRYLYGETALDGSTLPFGCLPDWGAMKVERITAIDRAKSPHGLLPVPNSAPWTS